MMVWIFDLDDTIISTARFYGYAAVDFIRLMLDTFACAWQSRQSPSWIEIAERIEEIDRQIGRLGACREERFPGVLLQCYRQLCGCERFGVGVAPDDAMEVTVWEIGESVFAPQNFTPALLIPGVAETLDLISSRRRGDMLFVVTQGDPDVQWEKWRGCGLSRWFPKRNFIVVEWVPGYKYSGGKGAVFAELRDDYPYHEVYVVGDSFEDDIAPAIKLGGMRAIYISPNRKAIFEEVCPPGVITLREFREIKGIIGL